MLKKDLQLVVRRYAYMYLRTYYVVHIRVDLHVVVNVLTCTTGTYRYLRVQNCTCSLRPVISSTAYLPRPRYMYTSVRRPSYNKPNRIYNLRVYSKCIYRTYMYMYMH